MALSCAFLTALNGAWTKRCTQYHPNLQIAWAQLFFALPVLVVFLSVSWPVQLPAVFFAYTGAALPLEVIALLFSITAFRRAALSLTFPMLAFTPLVILGVAFVLLGEQPSWAAVAGIAAVVCGAWLLGVSRRGSGVHPVAPLRALAKNSGVRYMLGTAFIYGFTSTLGRGALYHSSPMVFAGWYFSALAIVLTLVLASRQQWRTYLRPRQWTWRLLVLGLIRAAVVFTHVFALSMTQTAYFISVKRSSVVFAVILGAGMFQERDLGRRLAATVLMACGIAAIALFG